jgi:hypothetical protein
MNWGNVLPIGIAQLNRVMLYNRAVEPLSEVSVGSGVLTAIGDHDVQRGCTEFSFGYRMSNRKGVFCDLG